MVKLSAAWLAAVCFLKAAAFRAVVEEHDVIVLDTNDTSGWNFAGVQLNPDWQNGPLIPNLVPPPGHVFEVQNRERLDLIESNEYRWAFISIENKIANEVTPIQTWFATLQGGFFSNFFGARRTEITNNLGEGLFVIEMSKYIWNPTRLSWSFRLRHPTTNEIMYTINKDWFGAGFLFMRDEWRVYRGRRRDHNQIYHIIGGYFGYGHRFYHSKREWRQSVEPIGNASQSIGRSMLNLPDVYSLKVAEGEDTALLLATTVIIDMVHESERRARRRSSNGRRRSVNIGGVRISRSLLQEGEEDMESLEDQDLATRLMEEFSDPDAWSHEAMVMAEKRGE